jgi:hypothetical protein
MTRHEPSPVLLRLAERAVDLLHRVAVLEPGSPAQQRAAADLESTEARLKEQARKEATGGK